MTTSKEAPGERKEVDISDRGFYLDIMSHDLLNFNQAVLGYLELVLNDKSLKADLRRYLVSAIQQVRSSSQLIDDVKKIAHLESVNEEMFETLSLDVMVEESIKELKWLYPERDISVNLKNTLGRVKVKATDAMRDVALSLLANAAKFDPAKKVIIDVSIIRPEGKTGQVDLVVEDRGPGIVDPLRQSISEEITADERTKRTRGMGLLMARAVAKRFGGQLIIGERVPGDQTKGAKLIVRLPEVRR